MTIPFIGSFLSGLGIKLMIGGIVIALLTAGYFWISSIRAENHTLKINQQRLEEVITAKEQEIKVKQEAFIKQTEALNQLRKEASDQEARINDLIKLLGNGRLGKAAASKPDWIEKKINKANSKWLQEMRELTK